MSNHDETHKKNEMDDWWLWAFLFDLHQTVCFSMSQLEGVDSVETLTCWDESIPKVPEQFNTPAFLPPPLLGKLFIANKSMSWDIGTFLLSFETYYILRSACFAPQRRKTSPTYVQQNLCRLIYDPPSSPSKTDLWPPKAAKKHETQKKIEPPLIRHPLPDLRPPSKSKSQRLKDRLLYDPPKPPTTMIKDPKVKG